MVATYTYDPWGAPTGIYDANGSTISQTAYHVAAYNPFRYRGYRYDGDTRLYYLQSRYYDPVVGRFINADGYVSSGNGYMGYNMFAYCGNNPLNRIDPTGASWSDIKAAFKKFKSKVSHFISANFGLRYSTKVTTYNRQIPLIERILPLSVTVGTRRTRTVSETKDAKKTVSAYFERDLVHPFKSTTFGLRISVPNGNLDVSRGVDNTSVSASVIDGDTTYSLARKVDYSEFKSGIEFSETVNCQVKCNRIEK